MPKLTLRRSKLTARHWVYLLLHVVVFVIGVFLVREGNTAVSAIGSSLIAAAIAGWVLYVWVLVNQEQARRLEVLAGLGLVDAFTARSTRIKEHYDARLAGARQSIDILGFGLRQLREDYRADFASWAGRADVRILLIDPTPSGSGPSYADQRDAEEGTSAGTISTDVREFLAQTIDVRAQFPDTFRIRLYTTLPSINVFRVDDELFWGPYLVNTPSRNTPTFVIKRGAALFETILQHFDRLWQDDRFSHEPGDTSPTT